LHQTAIMNHASKGADRRRATAKTEIVNVITSLVVAAAKLMKIGNIPPKP